jgi:D-alanyl-D-alanine carboxypeptidase
MAVRTTLIVVLAASLGLAGCVAQSPPSSGPPPSPSIGPTVAPSLGAVDRAVRIVVEAGASKQVVGVVAIARSGNELWSGAFGTNPKSGKPYVVTDSMDIASVGKVFTAIGIARLVEQGRLRYADPVGMYVEGLAPAIAGQITIEHLVTHTSGYPGAGGRAPRFPPGTRYEYSTDGFDLLGKVIESVADTAYYDYMATDVYGPAGMTKTGYFAEPTPRGSPAGGGGEESTTADLEAFAAALLDGRLIDAETLEIVATPRIDGTWGPVGYGFGVRSGAGGPTLWHGGCDTDVGASFNVQPASGLTVVVLTRSGCAVSDPLTAAVLQELGMP